MNQTVSVIVQIDRAEAIRQGRAQYGQVVVQINPADLTQDEREQLAASPEKTGVLDPLDVYGGADYRPVIGNVDEPLAVVRELLTARKKWAAMAAEKQAQKKLDYDRRQTEYRAEYAAKCANPEKWVGTHYRTNRPEINEPGYSGFFASDQADLVRELPESRAARAEAEKNIAQQIAEKIADYVNQCANPDNWIDIDGEVNQPESGWLTQKENTEIAGRPESQAAKTAAEKIITERAAAKVLAAKRRAAQISSWIDTHGSANQQARHTAGLLPEAEVLDAIRSEAFAPLVSFPRYKKMEAANLWHDDCYGKIEFSVDDADEINAEQWDTMAKIRALMPTATLTARKHTAECGDCAVAETRYSLHAAITVGELELTREYAL